MSRRQLWTAFLVSCTFGAIFLLSVARMRADDDETRIRWDIITLTAGPTVHPGGRASAKDNIGDRITLTGSGTFVPRTGRGDSDKESRSVTGGGTWMIATTAGVSSTGTYKVTGLVRWDRAPGTFPALVDTIGNPADFRSGLAVLRMQYSDGSHGILVVSCHGAGTPDSVFEGITASKDFVDFWNREAPSGTPTGPNENRTAFHVVNDDDD
jgi:hypothetical protein